MLKKIKQLTVTFIAALTLAVPVMMPAMVHADAITDGVCGGVNAATDANSNGAADSSCANDTTNGNSSISKIIRTVINIFSLIIGAVAVIMIIYGGFKYITSGGNDGNVSGAKNTILYAVIGLVVVALAQVIVRYVLTQAKV